MKRFRSACWLRLASQTWWISALSSCEWTAGVSRPENRCVFTEKVRLKWPILLCVCVRACLRRCGSFSRSRSLSLLPSFFFFFLLDSVLLPLTLVLAKCTSKSQLPPLAACKSQTALLSVQHVGRCLKCGLLQQRTCLLAFVFGPVGFKM